MQASGLTLRCLRGAEITERHWEAFHRFYRSTTDKKWGRSAYLTKRFWPMLGDRLGDAVVLMMAERDGVPVAGALNLVGRDAIYGRNWGATVDVPFLHFELCYYMAMDFAIAHGIGARRGRRAGRAQDPARLPAGADLFRALDRASRPVRRGGEFLDRERPAMLREMEALATLSPFRRDDEA